MHENYGSTNDVNKLVWARSHSLCLIVHNLGIARNNYISITEQLNSPLQCEQLYVGAIWVQKNLPKKSVFIATHSSAKYLNVRFAFKRILLAYCLPKHPLLSIDYEMKQNKSITAHINRMSENLYWWYLKKSCWPHITCKKFKYLNIGFEIRSNANECKQNNVRRCNNK